MGTNILPSVVPHKVSQVQAGFLTEFVKSGKKLKVYRFDIRSGVEGPTRKADARRRWIFVAHQFELGVEVLPTHPRTRHQLKFRNSASQASVIENVAPLDAHNATQHISRWLIWKLLVPDADKLAPAT